MTEPPEVVGAECKEAPLQAALAYSNAFSNGEQCSCPGHFALVRGQGGLLYHWWIHV